MKVTKKGKLPEEEIWTGTCNNCNSELEAKKGELQVTHDQREGSFGRANCPVCEKDVIFFPKK